ncbi:MAG TPA: hypothetical protein VM077_04870 [Candidatus Limnocylindrales bacterium]|nr:hypothetical protein [Candidatus Limnocylindrales bacterium]
MKNITTLDILKTLPFEEAFKSNLLDNFEKFSPDQQYAIEDIIWDTYDSLCRLKIEENVELAMQKAKDKQEVLDQGFYDRIKQQTEKELEDNFTIAVASADLSETRDALQDIIKTNSSKKN